MSDLLQQAIIDAAALKEAAIKNAENALIEKYSQEFNQTVQKLLEQENVEAAQTASPDASASPLPPTNNQPADAAASAEPALDPSSLDPMSASGDVGVDANKKDAFSKVPAAFSDNSEEEKMITINFDQIRATLNEMLGTAQDPTPDAVAQGKAPIDLVDSEEENSEEIDLEKDSSEPIKVTIVDDSESEDEEELELEWELEEEQALASPEVVSAEKELADKKAAVPSAMEEDIELTEQELQELAEELKVDLKVGNLSDGYLGSTETQKREQRDLELAAARNEAAAKQREEEVKKMADLMQENANIKKLNSELVKVTESLKEQLEKNILSNAKLLYTNKALGNISLNERQKQNIVESISKADSVLAAKTIYETLQNAVENMETKKEAPQSLREALNRAPSPFVVKKTSANSINDLMAERLKALAGIKENK